MRGKTCVWLIWLMTTVISAGYGALSLYTFIEMTKLKKRGYKQKEDTASRWGLFAATILSFACVAFYVVFTLLVLLRKSFHAKADTGYGMILASAGHTAVILLLSSLVLHAAKPRAALWKRAGWFNANAYNAYWGTFVVGYMLCFLYALNALVLLFFKPAMDSHRQTAPTAQPALVPAAAHDVEAPLKPTAPVKPALAMETGAAAVASTTGDELAAHDQQKKKGMFGAWGKN